MAKRIDKEVLFENYFHTAVEVFATFEDVFDVEGVWSKIIGADDSEKNGFSTSQAEQAAKDHVRASGAWQTLSYLYDYAVDGIDGNQHPIDIVIGGAEVLSFIKTENRAPAIAWDQITAQGDGRHALDYGQSVVLEKVALLAGVDVRTVRNAVSGGELIAFKTDDGLAIDNASARSWLNGRRGFKPTVIVGEAINGLNEVTGPAEFGAFLVAQRKRIGLDGGEKKLVAFHPAVDAHAISEIETGVFKLPIDTAFPIADFYQLDRKEFLSCVMRVFFSEQLSTLRETLLVQ